MPINARTLIILALCLLVFPVLLGVIGGIAYLGMNADKFLPDYITSKFKERFPVDDIAAREYLLKPDTRVLKAVAWVHRLNHDQYGEGDTATARYKDGRWIVEYHGQQVGEVPALPGFNDYQRLLLDWNHRQRNLDAAKVLGSAEVQSFEAELNQFQPDAQFRLLRALNSHWRQSHNPALLPWACQSLTDLSVQQVDILDTQDEVAARALATCAMAVDASDRPRDSLTNMALLAKLMGYMPPATLTGELDRQDVRTAYVLEQDEVLGELGRQEGRPRARYLLLLRQGRAARPDQYDRLVASLGLEEDVRLTSMVKTLPRFRFAHQTRNGLQLIDYALLETDKHQQTLLEGVSWLNDSLTRSELRGALGQLLSGLSWKNSFRDFDARLENLRKQPAGAFYDGRLEADFYEGAFYSGWFQIYQFYTGQLGLSSRQDISQSFSLPEPAATGRSQKYRQWFDRILALRAGGTLSLKENIEYLDELDGIGSLPRFLFFDELTRYLGYGDPLNLKAVANFADGLDSRTVNRLLMADIAYSQLYDLGLMEALVKTANMGNERWAKKFQLTWAFLDGDMTTLVNLMNSPYVPAGRKAYYLGRMPRRGLVSADEAFEMFERLRHSEPKSWKVVKHYVDLLEKEERYRQAERVLQAYLAQGELGTFPYIHAQTALARIYQKQGRLNPALEHIQLVSRSGQRGAMVRHASILADTGNYRESEQMYLDAIRRYPSAYQTVVDYVRMLWERGRYSEAAAMLAAHRNQLTNAIWQLDIGKAFNGVFASKDHDRGLAAFEALQEKFSDYDSKFMRLSAMANAVKDPALAFEMRKRIQHPGMPGMKLDIGTYIKLKKYKGQKAALEWLNKKYPHQPGPISMISYGDHQDEILWAWYDDPSRHDGTPFIWLMRAAAWTREPVSSPTWDRHKQMLMDYYRDKGGSWDKYDHIGRYLMGFEDQEQILARIKTGKEKCEIPYYLAIKAIRDDRYQEASRWLQMSVGTGLTNNGEYRWALNILYNWYSSGRSLDVIRKEDPVMDHTYHQRGNEYRQG